MSNLIVLNGVVKDLISNYGDHNPDFYEIIINQVKRAGIETALRKNKGNQTKASKMLKVNRGTLRNDMKRLKIDKRGYSYESVSERIL
jgi:DNA-binding protein Fis